MIKSKMSKTKLLILIIDVIIIIGLTISIMIKLNKRNGEDVIIEEPTASNTFVYKKFTLKLPDGVEAKLGADDEFKFELSSDKWRAVVEIFLCGDETMIESPSKYYDTLIKNNYKVDVAHRFDINDKQVLIYNRYYDNNSLLCYFRGILTYGYEIELFNNDGSFDIMYVSDVMNILSDMDYDYETEKIYYYHIVDYSRDANLRDE